MIPIEPNIPIPYGWRRVVFAENQKEDYIPLPGIFENAKQGHLITRWKLTWKERIQVLLFDELWFTTMTFHQPLQPIMLDISKPKFGES